MSEPFLSRWACAVIGTLSGASAALCAGWFSRMLAELRDGLVDLMTW
jgi:hypothetical protein